MNLSDIVLYGSLTELELAVQKPNVELNQLDQYGYTPLIHAVIIDDAKKAECIIRAGADVNSTDITKRTALHWAVFNNNQAICEELLAHGASPNAYNMNSESVMVKAILQRNQALKKLLAAHGGNYQFALDYIDAKLIGHRFHLVGSVDIVDTHGVFTEVDYEGFYLEFSLDLIGYSLQHFRHNYSARAVRPWFKYIDPIAQALRNAERIFKYDHYLLKIHKKVNAVDPLFNHEPLIIPISQQGHAFSVIKAKNLLAICDRSQDTEPHNAIQIYFINRPTAFTKEFIKSFTFEAQAIKVIQRNLIEQLQLQPLVQIPISDQVTGNCSWANVEATIPVLMLLLQLNDPHNTANQEQKVNNSLEMYQRWREWDRNTALLFKLQEFQRASSARKASIAATLAAVLFQCLSAEIPEHAIWAKRIIPILKNSDYSYILQSYLSTYMQSTKTQAGKNLQLLLDKYENDLL